MNLKINKPKYTYNKGHKLGLPGLVMPPSSLITSCINLLELYIYIYIEIYNIACLMKGFLKLRPCLKHLKCVL